MSYRTQTVAEKTTINITDDINTEMSFYRKTQLKQLNGNKTSAKFCINKPKFYLDEDSFPFVLNRDWVTYCWVTLAQLKYVQNLLDWCKSVND